MIKKIQSKGHSLIWSIVVNGIASWSITPVGIRNKIYRLFGIDTHAFKIRDNCHFESNKVKIGEGTFINRYCYFLPKEEITIGSNCWVAPEVMFVSATHEIGEGNQRAGNNVGYPITVGDGSWIGARATILPGVNVGKGCIIAAGAVVTKDCKPNGVYAGVPARRVKDLD